MQSTMKKWLKLMISLIFFMVIWYVLFMMFDNHALYFGWVFAGICGYLAYQLLCILLD